MVAAAVRVQRQLGVVGASGEGATFTGAGCHPWAGGVTGDGYAIQGNILAGPQVVERMQEAFCASDPQAPLHRRLANAFGDWGVAWAAGYRIADTQSGQRYYPAEVVAMTDVPGEDFVYETQLLISASRRLGIRAVSIPVETRYCDEQGRRFRRSHFRPLRDLYRITSHVVGQVLAHGRVWHEYRQARANPPRVDTGV